MGRGIVVVVLSFFLLSNLYGCLFVGAAAGGAGTAVWLSGKLSQEVTAPLEKSTEAAKNALSSMELEVSKETVTQEMAQIMSNYTDGKTIWIDVHRISDTTSKIEVRVGAVGDKVAARKILNKIISYL